MTCLSQFVSCAALCAPKGPHQMKGNEQQSNWAHEHVCTCACIHLCVHVIHSPRVIQTARRRADGVQVDCLSASIKQDKIKDT